MDVIFLIISVIFLTCFLFHAFCVVLTLLKHRQQQFIQFWKNISFEKSENLQVPSVYRDDGFHESSKSAQNWSRLKNLNWTSKTQGSLWSDRSPKELPMNGLNTWTWTAVARPSFHKPWISDLGKIHEKCKNVFLICIGYYHPTYKWKSIWNNGISIGLSSLEIKTSTLNSSRSMSKRASWRGNPSANDVIGIPTCHIFLFPSKAESKIEKSIFEICFMFQVHWPDMLKSWTQPNNNIILYITLTQRPTSQFGTSQP